MEPHPTPAVIPHALTRTCLGLILVSSLLVGTGAAAPKGPASADAQLEQRERSKWSAELLGKPQILAMFAHDMLSVEYGFDTVPKTRRVNMVFMASQPPPATSPGSPPPRFELSDFRFVHPTPDSTIISYHVKSLTFPFDAYATSVWALREGKWMTVFYQATLTSPTTPGLNDFLPAKP